MSATSRTKRGDIRARLAALLMGLLVMGLGLGLTACGSGSGGSGVALPSGYPSNDVPLVGSATVVKASAVGAGWDVTVKVSDANAQKTALTDLQKKGFSIIGESKSTTGVAAYSLSNGSFSVRLGYGHDNTSGYTVEYGVARQASTQSQSTEKPSTAPKSSAKPTGK